jgi:hypothetical protein
MWSLLVHTIYKTWKRLSHTAARKFLLKFPVHSLVLVSRVIFEEFKRRKRTQIHQNMKIQLYIKFNNVQYKSAHRYCCAYTRKHKETTKMDLMTEHTFHRASYKWSWYGLHPIQCSIFWLLSLKPSRVTTIIREIHGSNRDWRLTPLTYAFVTFLFRFKDY